jgi:hypothetical protein
LQLISLKKPNSHIRCVYLVVVVLVSVALHVAAQNSVDPCLVSGLLSNTNLRARLNYSNMQPTTQEGVANAKENESIG